MKRGAQIVATSGVTDGSCRFARSRSLTICSFSIHDTHPKFLVVFEQRKVHGVVSWQYPQKGDEMRKLLAFITLVMFGTLSASGIAYADDKCLVTPDKVVTTYHDAVTRQEYRWTQEVPAVQEVSHTEFRFFRDIPAVAEVNHSEYQFSRDVPAVEKVSHMESRYVRTNPGSAAVTHEEFTYKKVVPAVDGVEECKYKKSVDDFKTQYHFAKYTKTRSATWVPTVSEPDRWWNWSPNDSQGPQDYTPDFPNDDRGTWQGPHNNGGPKQGTYGTFRNGGGNSSFFHREKGASTPGHWGDWSDFGPWTKWSPETHTSWEDSDEPLGSPQPHSDWRDGDTRYERVWQARWDGQTHEVKSGFHYEYEWFTSDPGTPWTKTDTPCRWKVEPKPEQTVWYKDGAWTTDTPGDPWVEADRRTVTDKEAVAPFEEWATKTGRTTDVDKADYFTEAEAATFDRGWSKYGEPIEVIDQEYVPGYTEYKTLDGTSKLLADAAWFTESAFEGWAQFNSRIVIDTPAVPGYREYKTTEGATLVLEEASWFKESAFEGWTQLDSKKVIDSEFIPGYSIYFVENGEPTLDLTDANWTVIDPGEPWLFVDERTVIDKEAYDTKKTIPATYGPCVDEDDGDGLRAVADPTPLIGLGVLAALGITGAVIAVRRRRQA